MATLRISYFGAVDNLSASSPMGSETLTTSTTSVQSSANSNGAVVAMIYADADHWVTIGNNPTATSSNGFFLPASTIFWIDMSPDLADKFAAITA